MNQRIPDIFHFVFGLKPQKKPFHLLHYLCLESCLQVNRPETVYFYCHHKPFGPYWDRIKDNLTLVRVNDVPLVNGFKYNDKAVQYYRYAHHSDFIRLEKLLERGGVYADMDTLFVNPLPRRLFDKPFVLGREQDVYSRQAGKALPSLCNAFIMSPRASEFGRLWLDRMEGEFDGSWSSHSGFLPQQLSGEHPDWIHVEPPRSFYKHRCTPEGVQTLFESCDPDFEDVYSMHLWHHMWAAWWRRDYCRFYEGMLTEEFIREVDTTYTIAARRFLPGRQWHFAAGSAVPAHKPSVRAPGLLDTALTRLGLFFVSRKESLREWRMKFVRLRRRWLFRNFSLEGSFDRNILTAILYDDEYGVAGEKFEPTDVIVDVGAHVGVFSYLCHRRGSRSVHCYEPGERNFRLLQRNLGSLSGVHLFNMAVWRSDRQAGTGLFLSGPEGENTGANSVLAAGRVIDFRHQRVHEDSSTGAHTVPSVPLDDILEKFDRVKLLKLDCEGSEFPILLTSRLLDKAERIVGEIHEATEDLMQSLDAQCRLEGCRAYSKDVLVKRLEAAGFTITTSRGPRHFSWFDARRVQQSSRSGAHDSSGRLLRD